MHLDRLTKMLEAVAVAGRPVTTSEVQKATGLPKPTCYRLIQSLSDENLLDQPSGDGKFVIGERLIRLALLGQSDSDVMRCTSPLLKSSANRFNETTFLSRFRNSNVEIIQVETPDDPTRAYIHPGLGIRPMHACSCSKAIAAFAEPEFQDRILSSGMKEYTEFTKVTKEDLRAEFEQIVKQGFADCDQEIDLGIASVAAPVMIQKIGATFSVGAVGPIRRFEKSYRHEIGRKLAKLSEQIAGAIQLSNAVKG